MSPSPKNSGSPSRQASIKQQRASQREAKLEAFRRQQKRRARNRLITIWGGVAAGVAVIAMIVAFIVTTPNSSSADIEGVQTFNNPAGHTQGSVDYPQSPPAGGEHNPVWLNCGIYEQQVPNENAVHALEHGAVWVTYQPGLSDDDIATLRDKLPDSYIVMSPFDGLDTRIALSAWNAQLKLDSVTDERIGAFLDTYWRSSSVPEPGASCTGALEGPGRVA